MRLRMNQAIARALGDEMREDARVVTWGEDIAEWGGVFQATKGLLEEFGPERVRDTPISELAFLGAGVGAAATGLRPVVEIMIVEFFGLALDQLVNQAAKYHYLSGGRLRVPLTVRASAGAGYSFGCQHSQTLENWFVGVPGLKLAVASGAESAYGLLRAAIRDDGPVVVLEPHTLYGVREEFTPGADAIWPLGKAKTVHQGSELTVVTLGQMVGIALEAAESSGWDVDLLDLRTLVPWDRAAVVSSVERTGRLVIIEESPQRGGWGSDVSSYVSEVLFGELTAPVLRITAPEAPVPYSPELERLWLPDADYVTSQIDEWLAIGRLPAPWWDRLQEVRL